MVMAQNFAETSRRSTGHEARPHLRDADVGKWGCGARSAAVRASDEFSQRVVTFFPAPQNETCKQEKGAARRPREKDSPSIIAPPTTPTTQPADDAVPVKPQIEPPQPKQRRVEGIRNDLNGKQGSWQACTDHDPCPCLVTNGMARKAVVALTLHGGTTKSVSIKDIAF